MPAYSIFEGTLAGGAVLADELARLGVTEVDVVGIATDHCVRASALDALAAGVNATVLANLTAPVDAVAGERALAEVEAAGGSVRRSL